MAHYSFYTLTHSTAVLALHCHLISFKVLYTVELKDLWSSTGSLTIKIAVNLSLLLCFCVSYLLHSFRMCDSLRHFSICSWLHRHWITVCFIASVTCCIPCCWDFSASSFRLVQARATHLALKHMCCSSVWLYALVRSLALLQCFVITSLRLLLPESGFCCCRSALPCLINPGFCNKASREQTIRKNNYTTVSRLQS